MATNLVLDDALIEDARKWGSQFGTFDFDPNAFDARKAAVLAELLADARSMIISPIRQELLSGVRDEAQFAPLQEWLQAFVDEPLVAPQFEQAA